MRIRHIHRFDKKLFAPSRAVHFLFQVKREFRVSSSEFRVQRQKTVNQQSFGGTKFRDLESKRARGLKIRMRQKTENIVRQQQYQDCLERDQEGSI
jgi:hypothetical protein